jgi:hypothetical protein
VLRWIPEGVIGLVEHASAQSKDRIQTLRSPAHTGSFGRGGDHRLASRLGNPTANMHAFGPKGRIAHTLGSGEEILRFSRNDSPPACGIEGQKSTHKTILWVLCIFEGFHSLCLSCRTIFLVSSTNLFGQLNIVFMHMKIVSAQQRTEAIGCVILARKI